MSIDKDLIAASLYEVANALAALDGVDDALKEAIATEILSRTLLGDKVSVLEATVGVLSTQLSALGARATKIESSLSTQINTLAARVTKLEAPPAPPMRLGAPYYCSPDTSTVKRWATLLAKGPSKIGLAVFNPSTKPDASINAGYVATLAAIKAAGIPAGVYVETGWLGKYGYGVGDYIPADGIRRDPANVQNILDEITRALTMYPSQVVFLDEMNTKTNDPVVAATMAKIRDHVHALGALAYWNPGTSFLESAMPLGDCFMRYEGGTAAKYLAFVPPTWHAKYPGKMWDCCYGVLPVDMPAVVARARTNGAALLWVTDDADSNPYNSYPTYLDGLCDLIK